MDNGFHCFGMLLAFPSGWRADIPCNDCCSFRLLISVIMLLCKYLVGIIILNAGITDFSNGDTPGKKEHEYHYHFHPAAVNAGRDSSSPNAVFGK